MSFPQLSLPELEAVATEVLTFLKSIAKYDSFKVAIIGGMAVWKYLPSGRTTKVKIELLLSD